MLSPRLRLVALATAIAVGVAPLTGCGTMTGIPSHGGGKRFAVEQRLVSASIRSTIMDLDLTPLQGHKRVAVNFNVIGDAGSGSLYGGRLNLLGAATSGYVSGPVTTTTGQFQIFTLNEATTSAAVANTNGIQTGTSANTQTGTSTSTETGTNSGSATTTDSGTANTTTNIGAVTQTSSGTNSSTSNNPSVTTTTTVPTVTTNTTTTPGTTTTTTGAVTTTQSTTPESSSTSTPGYSTTQTTGANVSTGSGSSSGTSTTGASTNTQSSTSGNTSNQTSSGSSSRTGSGTQTANQTGTSSGTNTAKTNTDTTTTTKKEQASAVPQSTQAQTKGSERKQEFVAQYKGMGDYQNYSAANSDIAFFYETFRTYMRLNGIEPVSVSDPSATAVLFVNVDIFGIVRSRFDAYVHNKETVKADTAIEIYAIDRSGKVIMRPQNANREAVYDENYVLWAGPFLTEEEVRKGKGLLVNFEKVDGTKKQYDSETRRFRWDQGNQ